MLVMTTGAFGMTGRLLYGFSVLMNAAVYGAMGWVTGLIFQRRGRQKGKCVPRQRPTHLEAASGPTLT